MFKRFRFDKLLAMAVHNLPLKILALILAIFAWIFVAKDYRSLVSLNVPVEVRNIPRGLALEANVDQQIEVRLQGPSSMLANLRPSDISMPLDLSKGRQGMQTVKFDLDAVKLPAGVRIRQVSPQEINVFLLETQRRTIPVYVKIKGWNTIRHRISKIEVEPREVEVEAPPEELARMRVIYTSELEVEPGTEPFTTITRLELTEKHARITSDPFIRVEIHFTQMMEESRQGYPKAAQPAVFER